MTIKELYECKQYHPITRDVNALKEEIEMLSLENMRLNNEIKDLHDSNYKLKEELSYRKAYPNNFC